MPLPFLTLNPGEVDELDVEVQTSNASKTWDTSGIGRERSLGGTAIVVVTHERRATFPGYLTKWLTTEEYQALEAATRYPAPITVGGLSLRTTTPDTVPQTMFVTVEVTEAEFMPVGDDWLHVAHLTIEQAD